MTPRGPTRLASTTRASTIYRSRNCRLANRRQPTTLKKQRPNGSLRSIFATTHGVNNYPWADSRNNTYSSSYGFNAGWTVWNGGQRENTIRRDKINVEISRLATDDLMRSIETDLLQVYLNILYARESIAIYEEASKLSKAQAERARQLMEAGRASKVDYAQLNSQYEQDRYARSMPVAPTTPAAWSSKAS